MTAVEKLKKRLLSRVTVDQTTGCWLFIGGQTGDGYGRFSVNGRLEVPHRTAYEMFVGEIPAGLQLDHLCRTRHCVNPDHLEPVTPSENIRRSFAARKLAGAVA